MTPDVAPIALRRIEVVPLGDIPVVTTDAILRRLSRRVTIPCRRGVAIPDDLLPRLAHRPQLDADAVLALLDARPRSRGTATLGVTAADLGHPLFTFFFGRARMGGSALISFHRLNPSFYGLPPDPELTLTRAICECLHELGHVAGLHHCDDYRCVMHFSGDAESIDVRGTSCCEPCAASLARPLRHALGH